MNRSYKGSSLSRISMSHTRAFLIYDQNDIKQQFDDPYLYNAVLDELSTEPLTDKPSATETFRMIIEDSNSGNDTHSSPRSFANRNAQLLKLEEYDPLNPSIFDLPHTYTTN